MGIFRIEEYGTFDLVFGDLDLIKLGLDCLKIECFIFNYGNYYNQLLEFSGISRAWALLISTLDMASLMESCWGTS